MPWLSSMTSRKTALVLGITADIGRAIAERLLSDNWNVIGLGRTLDRVSDLQGRKNLHLISSDVSKPTSIERAISELRELNLQWELFVSSVGTLEPIGKFFDLGFDAWERSLTVNFTGQLRVLHGAWAYRNLKSIVNIMLLAGGGTNSPFLNYSSYCVSKIALIKMCELISAETPEANAFIIGPGYVRTRIHEETLRAGPDAAGEAYQNTLDLLRGEGTSFNDIYEHMKWCISQGPSVVAGRNFSTVHDPWRHGAMALAGRLVNHLDAFRLRRRMLDD